MKVRISINQINGLFEKSIVTGEDQYPSGTGVEIKIKKESFQLFS